MPDARDRRHRMTQEYVERDLVGTCVCREPRIVETPDFGDKAHGGRDDVVTVRFHAGYALVDGAGAGFVADTTVPFQMPAQDLHSLPPQIVEDADRNEEILREAGNIDVAQGERGLAEAAELGAKARFVQTVAGSRRERGRALYCRLARASAKDEREWLAGGTQCRDIHASALGLSRGGNGGKAFPCAGEQRSFGGAHHRPASRNILRRLDRLPDLPVLPVDGPDAPDPEPAVAFVGACGMLEAEPVAALDRLRDRNDQLVLVAPDHCAQHRAAGVGLGPR